MTTEVETQNGETSSPTDRSPKTKNVSSSQGDEGLRIFAPAVEFRNVHFSYDEEIVLDNVSFNVMRGEIKIILSGSGGGKSTILKLILGLLKPDGGQVLIDGEDITNYDELKSDLASDQSNSY